MQQQHAKPVLEGPPQLNLSSLETFKDCLLQFGNSPLFYDCEEWETHDNPFRRTLRPHVFKYLDFSSPLSRDELLHYTSLTANRILTTIYELDFVFWPKCITPEKLNDFQAFYDPGLRQLASVIRPRLEQFAFQFLDSAVQIGGPWNAAAVTTLFEDFVERTKKTESLPILQAVRDSVDPKHAFKTLLIQLAPDFLVESSPMMRNVLGDYGEMQSALFKIVIDEFGYGVHRTKHSTLFKDLLVSIGLGDDAHRYWQFYLASSLMLNNYFNMISLDHRKFFRYVGAIFYAETSFIPLCRQMAELCREIYPDADATYFDEHAHIDVDHSRMVLDSLVKPALIAGGDWAAAEILRGYQEALLLSEISEADIIAQIRWSDENPALKVRHAALFGRIESGQVTVQVQTFVEPRGELSVTHVHDGDELCHVSAGVLRFVNGHDRYERLEPGQGIIIRRNRLHGAIVESDECTYHIHSVGDAEACLS